MTIYEKAHGFDRFYSFIHVPFVIFLVPGDDWVNVVYFVFTRDIECNWIA